MIESFRERSEVLKKSLGATAGSLLFFFGLFSPCLASGDGPPYFQIEQDWKTLMKSDESCNSCVRVSRVNVLDVDAKKKSATARIEIIGDWIGQKGVRSAGGACAGFSPEGGIHQVVGKTLRYRKLDSGWKLETKVAKSRHSGHRSARRH